MPKQILNIIKHVSSISGSDIHFRTNQPTFFRHNGILTKNSDEIITEQQIQEFLQKYAGIGYHQNKNVSPKQEYDFAITLEDSLRLRANLFYTNTGLALTLRLINSIIPTLEQINAPRIFTELTKYKKGLILITGATGSGKSTTMSAILNTINQNQKGHIITIEDPIEYVYENANCLVSQREVGLHTSSFASALKYALREDPDYIAVGELRDLETIALALTAAETGHLVFGTLHTSSAVQTVDRIIDVFPANQQNQIRCLLAETLTAVISQELVLIDKSGNDNTKGNSTPNTTQKRTACFEVLIAISAIKNLIREGKTHQIKNFMQTGANVGMQTMEEAKKMRMC